RGASLLLGTGPRGRLHGAGHGRPCQPARSHDGDRLPESRASGHSHPAIHRGRNGPGVADDASPVTDHPSRIEFDQGRFATLLAQLGPRAAGEPARLPISPARDELDAIAYAVNVLGDELHYTNTRIAEEERQRGQELMAAKERAE